MPSNYGPKVYFPNENGGDVVNVASGGMIDGSGGAAGAGGDIIKNYALASASGAVSLKSGTLVITKTGSLAALTIADPTSGAPSAGGDDGKELTVIAGTAYAHTLSNAAGSGFNSGGSASDVGTFGGAIGDNIQLIAYGGKWLVKSVRNVTLA